MKIHKSNLLFFIFLLLTNILEYADPNANNYPQLEPSYLIEIIKKLEQGENVIVTKFGDGEYNCMVASDNPDYADYPIFGRNCDGDPYHKWLGQALKKALINLSKKPNTYIGKWPIQNVYQYYNTLSNYIPFVSYHLIMNDDEFLKYPYLFELVKFVINAPRKKIVIANAKNHRLKDLFKADIYIEIPSTAWSKEYDKWKKTIERHLEENAIVLIAGGLCSKVLINDITNKHKVSFIDLGSSFDIIGSKEKSRPWYHSFEDELKYYKNLMPWHNEKVIIEHVKNSIEKAKNGISKLTNEALKLEGMSSKKVRHLLNNICALSYATYLEIGVWKGSTLVSALLGNTNLLADAVAIDNWAQFGGPQNEFLSNISKFLSNNSVRIYSQDCFAICKEKVFSQPVNIYFYDGNHEGDSQYQAFTYFNDIFSDIFIAIIDDWNYEPVSKGTRQAFKDLNYTVLFEEILPANFNGDTQNWWNGLYVGVIKKQ